MDHQLSDSDIEELLERAGLEYDPGSLISGTFIPDGTYRIFDPEDPCRVLGQGDSLQEAFDDLPSEYEHIRY